MNLRPATSFLLLVLCAGAALGEELPLTEAQIANLGIAFERPQRIEASPSIDARARVTVPPSADHAITSPVAGVVRRVLVGSGDRVEAGAPIVEIASADFVTLQQEYLASVQSAELANARLARDRQLAADGIIAERRLEETRAEAVAANAMRDEHRQLLRLAGVDAPSLQALQEKQQLRDTLVLRAPVDAVVLEVASRAGQRIDPVDVVCRIADLSELWLDIRLPEGQLAGVGRGVVVNIGATGGRAVVEAVGRSVDAVSQTVSVRARVTSLSGDLLPGQLVAVTLLTMTSGDSGGITLAVPVTSVARSGDSAWVFKRSANGVTPVRVDVVSTRGNRVVLQGLTPDAEIVTSGVSALKAFWLASAPTEG